MPYLREPFLRNWKRIIKIRQVKATLRGWTEDMMDIFNRETIHVYWNRHIAYRSEQVWEQWGLTICQCIRQSGKHLQIVLRIQIFICHAMLSLRRRLTALLWETWKHTYGEKQMLKDGISNPPKRLL